MSMRKGTALLLIVAIIGLSSLEGAAAATDYLAVPAGGFDVNPKERVKVGEPISADVTLKRIGDILPETATLILTIDMVNAWTQVDIDGSVQTFANANDIEIPLPSAGVKEIKITVRGNAPDVDRLMRLRVLEVKTDVAYKGTPREVQEEVSIFLEVSNPDIQAAVETIDRARRRFQASESRIQDLKAQGIDTVDLEARLQNARELIETAEGLQGQGRLEESRQTAQVALSILSDIDSQAEAKAGDVLANPTKVRKYLLFGGLGVFVLLLAFLFFRSRREELG
jgi:hypothetical protein